MPDKVSDQVRSFYRDLPFNYYTTAELAAEQILNNTVETTYPDLHRLLGRSDIHTVYEFGCGAGWLSNSIALHYDKQVTAVDFTAKAVQRAREVADYIAIETPPNFLVGNLFEIELENTADLVVSMGVLHHTADPKGGFQRIARLVATGGYIYLGLYHRYGREPFLRLFREIMETQGEQAALQHYAQMTHTRPEDRTYLQSWFRDQVLHPHESQHTLQEVCGWLDEAGFALTSSSINRFQAFESRQQLFDLEPEYAQLSQQANYDEGRYFPGFFTLLAQKQ